MQSISSDIAVLLTDWLEDAKRPWNEELYQKLQPEIMPHLLGSGVIKPNAFRVVEGDTLLQRVVRVFSVPSTAWEQ